MPPLKHQPPFPYYGSKGMLAPWIVEHLPDGESYIEPFAGSAAVLLRKQPSRYEVINDLDGNVANFWRVLRDQPDELVEVLQLTPYGRDEYLSAKAAQPGTPLERARVFFIRSCMSFSGTQAGGFSFSGFNRGHKPPTFSRRVDSRLLVVAERIRDVEIENTDALKLLARWDDPRTVAYLDPPYLNNTRASRNDYATDNGGEDFHVSLLGALSRFKGAAVLSGYESDLYDQLGWRKVTRDVSAYVSNTKGARRAECLWINR